MKTVVVSADTRRSMLTLMVRLVALQLQNRVGHMGVNFPHTCCVSCVARGFRNIYARETICMYPMCLLRETHVAFTFHVSCTVHVHRMLEKVCVFVCAYHAS